MARARNWMSDLMLQAPAPLRSSRSLPVIRNMIHRLSHRYLPADEKISARIEVGPDQDLWLKLNPRTGQNHVRGEAENAVQRILAARLCPGMVFYDLGSNIGLFTLLAARLVGVAGKVFSFESEPVVAARLRRNVERNQSANVTVVEAVVWSSNGNADFVTADLSSPDRGVGRFVTGESGASGTPIPCVTLYDFARNPPATKRNQVRCRRCRSRSVSWGGKVAASPARGLFAKCILNRTSDARANFYSALATEWIRWTSITSWQCLYEFVGDRWRPHKRNDDRARVPHAQNSRR